MANFIPWVLRKNEKKIARSFNSNFRYTDDVFSLNISKFGNFVDSFYPRVVEIKDTTNIARSASYLALHIDIDSEGFIPCPTHRH